ncbi:MAG: phage portal protein [Pseudonocardiaceae bacterium]
MQVSLPISTSALPKSGLTDDERAIVARLDAKLSARSPMLRLSEAYYLGEQVIDNLRIAVPKELEFLRTIVGWPALAVDPYVERLSIDGFRLRGATDADESLGDLADEIGLGSLLPLAVTDALSLGRGYWLVGSPRESGAAPDVTVESPLNVAVDWDLRGTTAKAVWQRYQQAGRAHAALLRPRKTIEFAANDAGEWEVVGVDEHDLDFVPIVRMPHMPRSNARGGRSAIIPALRSATDSACRDLLSLEIAREIYSVPGITLLGAAESAFQNSDGTAKSAFEAYITRFRALERDEDGQLPEIHQQQVYDPATFTKLIDMRASQVASMVAAPPQDLGLYTQGNPTSADSADVMEKRRNRRAKLMQKPFGASVVELMHTVLRFENAGDLPEQYRRMVADWEDVDEVSMGTASDGLSKQVAAGMIPATSDVTLKRAGYSAVERQRLARDRSADDNRNLTRALVNGLVPTQQTPQEPTSGDAAGI